MVPVFKNVGERSTAKNYHPVCLLSVVSKVFEKLVNIRIVDLLWKYGLFSDFQYGFRSSWSTANLLTVVSDRIARAFNRSGATQAIGKYSGQKPLFLPHPQILKPLFLFYFRIICSCHYCHHFHLRFCWVLSIGWEEMIFCQKFKKRGVKH